MVLVEAEKEELKKKKEAKKKNNQIPSSDNTNAEDSPSADALAETNGEANVDEHNAGGVSMHSPDKIQ